LYETGERNVQCFLWKQSLSQEQSKQPWVSNDCRHSTKDIDAHSVACGAFKEWKWKPFKPTNTILM
jgi:hypothetical protein